VRIAHLCLSCFYIDAFAYQENKLAAQHVAEGHEVTIIASTETFNEARQLDYTEPGDYLGTDGARVIRLPYRQLLPHALAKKVRSYPGVRALLEELRPEVIVFHGLCAWELITVANYVRRNPGVRLHADCHEDFNNSARNLLSEWMLHRLFYRQVLNWSRSRLSSILCVSTESIDFAHRVYGIPRDRLEYFPLGGEIPSDDLYTSKRRAVRSEFGWSDSHRVFLQSGKIDRAKRLDRTLQAFARTPDPHVRLIIAGHLMPEVLAIAEPFMRSDPRVTFLDWVSPDRLQDLLCGVDVYVQPGSQSATMQMALCCRRPVIVDDVPSHRRLITDNGVLVGSTDSLAEAIQRLSVMDASDLQEMSGRAHGVAMRFLDYRKQAQRLLEA
jgi:glycosyltransferase involved in cell wall biosynthesis